MDNDIPYLLLTPGPLTTSRRVREAMMRDYSTWDVDYNSLVDRVRDQLVRLATNEDGYTCVLMQGNQNSGVGSYLNGCIVTVYPPLILCQMLKNHLENI